MTPQSTGLDYSSSPSAAFVISADAKPEPPIILTQPREFLFSMSVWDFLWRWLSDEARANVRPKTYEGYATNVNKHIVPLITRRRPTRLSIRGVQSMMSALSNAQHVRVRGVGAESQERRALTPEQGEILGLRWSDVDLYKGTLAVQQTVQRVDGALQAMPAHAALAAVRGRRIADTAGVSRVRAESGQVARQRVGHYLTDRRAA